MYRSMVTKEQGVTDKKLVDFLLLNAYSMDETGLSNGKAGIALTLFELSRTWKDSKIEEHAFNILQGALVKRSDCSFANGNAGIGYVLDYLIRYRFIEADYKELFLEQHHGVLNVILSNKVRSMDMLEAVRLWYFVERKVLEGLKEEHQIAAQILRKRIEDYTRQFDMEENFDFLFFFRLSSSILYALLKENMLDNGMIQGWVQKVLLLKSKGYICNQPWLGFVLKEHGKKSGNRDLEQIGQETLAMTVKNTIPGVCLLQQLIDTWVCLKGEKDTHYCEKYACINDFISKPEVQILKNSITYPNFYIGLECGIPRFLLGKYGGDEGNKERIMEILNLTI